MSLSQLPSVNAALNTGSACLLFIGWLFIRCGKRDAHRFCMVSAFALSALFLASYLYYHARAGVIHYRGAWPQIYFPILVSHTILAILIVPLVLRTLFLAAKGRFDAHRAWARWTFPIWLYVSVTGVVVFRMLYR